MQLTASGKRKVRDAIRPWRRAQGRAEDLLPPGAIKKLQQLGDAVGVHPDDGA